MVFVIMVALFILNALDPIALRTAKTLWSFDHFECNRVKGTSTIIWYGHVERSNGAVKTAFDIQVNGKRLSDETLNQNGALKMVKTP